MMSDELRYHTLAELQVLSDEQLQALWDLVPVERRKAYRAAYERELRLAGAGGSDALEMQLAEGLLARYEQSALVPAGSRWVKAPARVREAAQHGVAPAVPENAVIHEAKPSPKLALVLLGVGLLLVIFMLTRLTSGDDDVPLDVEPTQTATPTPEVSPTPTPLALEAQDDVIAGGDRERAVAYPVNLQITLPDGQPPRVWVVQRRVVRSAEWRYDANPDIASFVSGMSVRPVIGIPFSDENAAFFDTLDDGAIFTVTMNTGAILRYEFAARSEVLRSDTAIFRQVSPGLVLLLIGETDEFGQPTATRRLITALYPPEQELGRDGVVPGLSAMAAQTAVPEPTPEPVEVNAWDAVNVQIVSVTHERDRLTTQLRLYNGGDHALTVTPDDIWLALGYAPDPPGPRQPAESMRSFVLLPEQAVNLTLVWRWRGEPFAALSVGAWRWAVAVGG